MPLDPKVLNRKITRLRNYKNFSSQLPRYAEPTRIFRNRAGLAPCPRAHHLLRLPFAAIREFPTASTRRASRLRPSNSKNSVVIPE